MVIKLSQNQKHKNGDTFLSEAVKQFAKFYEPIQKAILKEVFSEEVVVYADETRINCQWREGEEQGLKVTYFWAYRSEKGCFFHHGSRRAKEIQEVFGQLGLLKEEDREGEKKEVIQWSGYLMTDDYSGYESALLHSKVVHMACMAHVQRKFKELEEGYGSAKRFTLRSKSCMK